MTEAVAVAPPPIIQRPDTPAPVAAPPGRGTEPPPRTVLLFEKVSKWYGPVIGVNQVTLELRPGLTGLVGANGAGKTTLMRLATGQLRPDQGRVTILGRDARSLDARLLVGYCPDVDRFYEDMSGRQFVHSMARLCGYSRAAARERTEAVLHRVGMADRSDRRLKGYSKGMRQRIKLAQALLHDPPLLILDEPFSGIDPIGRAELVEVFLALSGQGKCLLVSSHELEELEKLTDQVVIMARGRVAAVGTVAEIRARIEDQPLSIRIEVDRADEHDPARFHVEQAVLNGTPPKRGQRHRELAARLVQLPQVVSVEVAEDDPLNFAVGRLTVRARNASDFFREFGRLVLEEWYEVRRLESLDESTAAVLNYLLGGRSTSPGIA